LGRLLNEYLCMGKEREKGDIRKIREKDKDKEKR
jgi:hypothetical protein